MFWLIAKKDFLLNLISARFIIGFLLCLVIIPFTLIVSVDSYLNQERIYKIEQEAAKKELESLHVYSALRPTVVQQPEALSIFSKGISENIGNKIKINFGEYPLFPEGHTSTRDNPLLNAFFSIDFSTVIAILISLLALVFSYDAITREREEGTMKLAFTGKVSRISFLAGKIMGLLLTLLPILLFCYLLAGLIIMLNPDIRFSPQNWLEIGILFLMSMVYMLVFILLGICISSLTKQSSSAIILSLLCWIWFLFLMPNIASYLAQNFTEIPLYENVQSSMLEYDKESNQKSDDYQKVLFKELNIQGLSFYNCSWGRDGLMEMYGGNKEMTLYLQRMSAYHEPVRIGYADKKWTIQKDYLDQLMRQQQIRQQLAWLSPSELFTQTTDALCHTDVNAFNKYMENVRNYRERLITHFIDNKQFSSYKYFTYQPEDEFPTAQEWEDIQSGKLKSSLTYGWQPKEKPVLELNGFPEYVQQDTSIMGTIQMALGSISALLGIVIALLVAGIIVFMRYDIR